MKKQENKREKIDHIDLHYSMCKAYLRGNIQDVFNSYYGLSTFSNDAMKNGIEIHEEIAKKKIKLFDGMGECDWEFKKSIELTPNITYTGTVDCIDWGNKIIYDWKSGTTDVNKIDPMQLYCYSLLFEDIKEGRMVKVERVPGHKAIRYGDWVIYQVTKSKQDKARNWLETLGLEIMNVLNNLDEKEGEIKW